MSDDKQTEAWNEIAQANEEGRRNVEGADAKELPTPEEVRGILPKPPPGGWAMTERDEIADALEFLAGVDEGENTDHDRLLELAKQVRGPVRGPWEGDVVPPWLREMLGPKDDEERRQRRIDLIAEVIRLREERENLQETVKVLTEAGQHHVLASEIMRQTLGSMLDVLDELCLGLAHGQTPDVPWAETVSQTLSEHRQKLGFNRNEAT